jgi:hypothetical protein
VDGLLNKYYVISYLSIPHETPLIWGNDFGKEIFKMPRDDFGQNFVGVITKRDGFELGEG